MANYLVAGAGHGGLCAALHLARAGESVTVVERRREGAQGYDWTDAIARSVLKRNGFNNLPESSMQDNFLATMWGPTKRFSGPPGEGRVLEGQAHFERRELLKTMISDCLEAGVKFLYETSVLGPVIKDGRVCGLRVSEKGSKEERELFADMVIDAAGWHSPVRRGLPENSLIPKALKKGQIFYAWRGIFDRVPGIEPEHMFNIYLGHQGRRGLSWVITNADNTDVLIGNMDSPLSVTEIAAGMRDLREDNPVLGKRLLRGGQKTAIPVRRPLGAMVADGYAAVGDSACMTDPFGGSGVDSAMDQGRLLAEVLLEHCTVSGTDGGDFSIAKLWRDQYRCFTEKPAADFGYGTKTAGQRAETDVLKAVIMSLCPRDIDLLFERGIINLGNISGIKDVTGLLRNNLDHLPLLGKLAKVVVLGGKLKSHVGGIPEEYEHDAVAAWVKAYENARVC